MKNRDTNTDLVELDERTAEWLLKLAARMGMKPGDVAASLLFHIMLDDESTHSAALH
jgi:hypothetical protein